MSIKKRKNILVFLCGKGVFPEKIAYFSTKKEGFSPLAAYLPPLFALFYPSSSLIKNFFTFFHIFNLFSTFLLNYVKINGIISSFYLFGGKVCLFTSISRWGLSSFAQPLYSYPTFAIAGYFTRRREFLLKRMSTKFPPGRFTSPTEIKW